MVKMNNTCFTGDGGGGGCSLDSPDRTSAEKSVMEVNTLEW